MQEKAYLIVADKAVKHIELQCQGSVTGQQETGNITNHESGSLDRKPNNLRGDANMDVAIPPIQAINTRGGAINLDGIPGPARRYDPNYYARKMQAEYMENAKTFLQQGPLTAARIEKFYLCKRTSYKLHSLSI